jgi:hypothetical protein
MITLRLEFKLEDFWVGAFWRVTRAKVGDKEPCLAFDLWVCLVPCLPLHLTIWRKLEIPF